MQSSEEIDVEFESLVVRFWDRIITDDELARLHVILEHSCDKMLEFRELYELWVLLEDNRSGKSFNSDFTFNLMNGRVKRRNVRLRRFSWAASIAILLSVGGYLLYQNMGQGGSIARENVIMAHRNDHVGKVFLEVSANKKIELVPDSLKSISELYKDTVGQNEMTETGGLDEKWRRLFTTKGAEYSVMLSDGTKVWLNAESELKYPNVFTGEVREVYLKGEAYFDVTKNREKKFVVHSSRGRVTVLGTSFNVNDYAGEIAASVTLVEGVVVVQDKNKREEKILPGQQVLLGEAGIKSVHQADVDEVIAWKNGLFVFRNETLDHILTSLARWYDLDIFYWNQQVAKDVFTAKFERFDSVDIILQRLEHVCDVKFERKGQTIIVKEKQRE